MRRRRTPMLALCAWASLFSATAAADDAIPASLHRALGYLIANQNSDGGYGPSADDARIEGASDVGITGLVLTAIARHPRDYKAVDGPFVSRAVDFLLSKQQPDGGFYDPRDPVLKNYRTSVVVMALAALDPALYAEPISKARDYIASLQMDDSNGYAADQHLSYGGVHYGGSSFRADLSNSGIGSDALHAAGLSASHQVWRRLEVFTARCQNFKDLDPLLARSGIGTTGDGGFRYAPNDTRGPVESIDGQRVFASYGSMTYQGLKTFLYAGVSKSDPRVVAAFDWIAANFSVKENPGMASRYNPKAGQQGLFYYYHTMAKALAAYGEAVIVDARGVRHEWARELSAHLIALQGDDGSWVNASDRWWENIKALDTAFAMIALSICDEEIAKTAAAPEPPASAEPKNGAAKDGEKR